MGTHAASASVRQRRYPNAALPMQFYSGRLWFAAHVVVVTVSFLLLPSAGAQEPGEILELIIVTGSRIARPDFESASPIVSITADAFARTSSTSVDSVVSQLPQFSPDFTSTSNNPSNGGQGNVQLRGLGATSTLVLLDGRRIVPANGNGVVDVNVIPASLVESVEVVSGGASAVYGSDAIAGRDHEVEDYTVPSFDYFDLFASYVIDEGMLDGLTLRAGVENLADEDPPLVINSTEANMDPSQYDVRAPLLLQSDVPVLIATPPTET